MYTGTGKRYGAQSERGEIEAWGGIVSARLSDYASALDSTPQAVLDTVEAEGIEPAVDTAEAKGQGSDEERPTDPELRCLAFTREDFARIVDAAGSEPATRETRGDSRGEEAAVSAPSGVGKH